MIVTKDQIRELKPCAQYWRWYCEKQRPEDLHTLLIETNKNSPANARWIFTKLMSKPQCVEIAIFSAKEVLHVYEEKYPKNLRPRNAIEASETWLNSQTEKNRDAAAYAADAAADAYYATAAYYAAYYADAAADAAEKEKLQLKIIDEAVRILE